jgi:spore coat protein CotH
MHLLGHCKSLLVAAPLLLISTFASALTLAELYDPLVVRSIAIQMAPQDWDVIRKDLTNEIKKPGILTLDGGESVAIEIRRKSSRGLPNEVEPQKVGLKVDITGAAVWNGVKKLSLENGSDASPLKEGMAWALQQLAAPAPYNAALAAWVNVSLNGSPLGVYVSVEQRDKQFLRNRSLLVTASTWMYKQDDIGVPEREVAPTEDAANALFNSPVYNALCYAPFLPATTSTVKKGKPAAAAGCATPSDAQLSTDLNTYIDMDAMLRQGAVDAFTDNGDALFTHGKNFFVVDFTMDRGKRLYYPWDLDGVFRSTTAGIYGVVDRRGRVTQSPYQKVILNHPEFRVKYRDIFYALNAGPLSVGNLDAFVSSVQLNLSAAIQADPYQPGSDGDFQSMKNWFVARWGSVLQQLNSNLPAPRN